MDKRWLKDRALKDHRCAGMTKFLQSDEQKRLERLRNIKSTVTGSRKHNDYISKKYAERAKSLKRDRLTREKKLLKLNGVDEPPDFQVFVGCAEGDDRVTKSGLKAREQRDMLPSEIPIKNDVYTRRRNTRLLEKTKSKDENHENLMLSKHGQRIEQRMKELNLDQAPIENEVLQAYQLEMPRSSCMRNKENTSFF